MAQWRECWTGSTASWKWQKKRQMVACLRNETLFLLSIGGTKRSFECCWSRVQQFPDLAPPNKCQLELTTARVFRPSLACYKTNKQTDERTEQENFELGTRVLAAPAGAVARVQTMSIRVGYSLMLRNGEIKSLTVSISGPCLTQHLQPLDWVILIVFFLFGVLCFVCSRL